jgi:HCOMODA/2-hydroxy-3-carboxy-muconic semialdehyde decarboxylase
MSDLDDVIRDLVLANRILAHEGVVDAYGHVSVRSPRDPGRYFISVSRSPEIVTHDDIIECTLDGAPVRAEKRALYIERHIHGAIYERRSAITSVVHSHALDVLPFTISSVPLQPVIHSGGLLGQRIRVWDIADRFGDTSLLVANMDHGRDLAERLADDRVVLMRAHGFAAGGRSISEAVRISVGMPRNAHAMLAAKLLGGSVKPLTPGEIDIRVQGRPEGPELYRAWEYWAIRAGCADLLKPTGTRRSAPKKKAAAKKAPRRKTSRRG